MIEFQNILKQDYDNRVAIGKQHVLCYSKKRLRALHPAGDFRIVGESRSPVAESGTPSSAPTDEQPKKKKRTVPHIGECAVGGQRLGVASRGAYNPFLYKKAGYLAVGEGQYVCLLTSRLPFFSVLFSALVAFSVGLTIVLTMGGGNIGPGPGPGPIPPDHPLPPEDENSLPVEDDESEKVDKEEGGGSVSMIYTKEAVLDLSKETLSIYFVNPNASNHDVVIYLYLEVAEGDRRLIANSGRLVPGKGIILFHLKPDAPTLMEGVYDNGVYVIDFYDSESGERAVLSSEIVGVKITVKNGKQVLFIPGIFGLFRSAASKGRRNDNKYVFQFILKQERNPSP